MLFNAIAVGTHIASPLPGDARTWHLPDRAIARLGKGRLGEGDRAVSFSPDGLCVAVASRIGVWVYELATFHELALLPTANSIYSIAFSPDGKTLALGFYEGMVELWDVATSTRIITLTRHMNTKWGTSVAFSSDGTILASMSEKEDIKLWDIETGRNIATLGTQEFRGGSLPKSISVSFSPDGTTLASSSADHEVKLWDVATGTQIATLPGHRLRVTSVAFSPDGTILASGSDDGTVKLWDVARRESIETLKGHGGKVKSVSFSRDGKTLVSGSNDTEVKLWDVTTGTAIATLSGGHTSWVTSARFSPDGTIVASGSSQDGTILLWDVATENAATFPGIGHADVGNSLAFSPDGKMLASSSEDGTPKLWDTETGRHIRSFGLRPWGIQVVAFSPDSTTLAAGSLDNTIDLWNVATGEKIASFKRGGQILSMAFSPDGTMLAAGDPKGVSLWDIATVSAASAALGGQVVSGDMAADHHISTPLGQTDWVESMAFSPDGTTLASGSHNSTFTLWDASTLAYIVTLPGGGGPASWITSLAFSPDGTTFASAGSYIFLWNVATGNGASLSRSGQVDAGNSVAFSPKGKMLATGSSGGQVKLWDVATREQIAILEGHTDKVESLSFSPYGTTLASGSEDGTILLWDMSPYIRPEVSNPDFDGNGTVGFSDFLLFVDQFGLSQGDAGYDARFDLDGDGIIGISDFLIFVNAFGKEAS